MSATHKDLVGIARIGTRVGRAMSVLNALEVLRAPEGLSDELPAFTALLDDAIATLDAAVGVLDDEVYARLDAAATPGEERAA